MSRRNPSASAANGPSLSQPGVELVCDMLSGLVPQLTRP
jgi:hypothetical protein